MPAANDVLSLGNRHRLYRLRTRMLSTTAASARKAAVVLGAVAIGWTTAWYMVEAGSQLTTNKVGPWVSWFAAARPEADPYTRAHVARSGSLPLNSDIARIWTARSDDAGERLHSACDYQIEGALTVAWWSIAVFDDKGRLIANPAGRYSYSTDTVALSPTSTFSVALGRDARPGNWLPTGGAGRLTVQLTMLDQRSVLAGQEASGATQLPRIKRINCR